jgi:hypothetical protein
MNTKINVQFATSMYKLKNVVLIIAFIAFLELKKFKDNLHKKLIHKKKFK